MIALFLAGDVMIGRGIDQVLPYPGDPQLYESYVISAHDYVELAERANGPFARPLTFGDLWGDALAELERRRPDARIVNLETAVTQCTEPEPKGINYKVNPANVGAITVAGIDCCVVAHNHVLDWGPAGLIETLTTPEQSALPALKTIVLVCAAYFALRQDGHS
jgi:poly-gamma-glutamate synthesis protein (capsule biosynthesis protein)